MTNTSMTPISQEKPREQVKSALHQEVSELNPSGQMSMKQLIEVVLNLQEEVKKFRKTKPTEFINNRIQDTLDLRMINQKREIDALRNYQREKFNQKNSQVQKMQEKNAQMENILQSQKIQFSQQNLREHIMEIEEQKPQKIQFLGKRIKKKCYYCNSERHLYKNCLKLQHFKKQY